MLLFSFLLASTSAGQRLQPIDTSVTQEQLFQLLQRLPDRQTVLPENFQERAVQDFERAMQRFLNLLEESQVEDATRRELRRAVQELLRASQQFHGQAPRSEAVNQRPQPSDRGTRPAEPPQPAFNPVRQPALSERSPFPVPRNVEPLNTEREKAYIELARQYFYVFASTPPEPPVTIRSLAEQMATAASKSADASALENGGEVEAEKPMDSKEEWTRKREEILKNFVECVRKISSPAQITLISELIRSSHSNEELKLLEGLLDEVSVAH